MCGSVSRTDEQIVCAWPECEEMVDHASLVIFDHVVCVCLILLCIKPCHVQQMCESDVWVCVWETNV